jgi:hypothetical protein
MGVLGRSSRARKKKEMSEGEPRGVPPLQPTVTEN